MSDEPEGPEEKPPSPEREAYWLEFFRLKDALILMALREAEWYYENRSARDQPEHAAMSDAVSDAFEDAARAFAFYLIKPIPD